MKKLFIGISRNIEKYLNDNGIVIIDHLIGRTVYLAYPSQGIKCFNIRKLEYTYKKREWHFVADCSHKLSELGENIFFTEEEARLWQIKRLNKYTAEQQDKILRREYENKENEIKQLKRLLAKYPDEDSRKMPDKCCGTCVYNVEPMVPHTCDECTSLDQDEMYTMWKWNGKDL